MHVRQKRVWGERLSPHTHGGGVLPISQAALGSIKAGRLRRAAISVVQASPDYGNVCLRIADLYGSKMLINGVRAWI